MPTNRNKRTRKFKPSSISPAMRYFLITGDYCLREKSLEVHPREKFEIFNLAQTGSAARERLLAVWELHRDEVLKNWKLKKKKGLPWAAVLFDKE